MRMTLNIDDALLEDARLLTGIQDASSLVEAALGALIARQTERGLAALGGSDPDAAAGRRHRPDRD